MRYGDSLQSHLIQVALIQPVYTVDALHARHIIERDPSWSDAHDRTIDFEETMDDLTLSKAEQASPEPKIRDRRVPRARDVAKGGEVEVVHSIYEAVETSSDGEGKQQGGEHRGKGPSQSRSSSSRYSIDREWTAAWFSATDRLLKASDQVLELRGEPCDLHLYKPSSF